MKEVSEVLAIADKGLDRCAHGQQGTPRQVLLMDSETLEELQLEPGAIKENILARGLDVRRLRRGQRLSIGEALLEVTLPCAPCKRMDDIRPGLQRELRGRRGMLCRILEGGRIVTGDPIHLLEPAQEAATMQG